MPLVWECIGIVVLSFIISAGVVFYSLGMAPILDELKRAEDFHKKSGDL